MASTNCWCFGVSGRSGNPCAGVSPSVLKVQKYKPDKGLSLHGRARQSLLLWECMLRPQTAFLSAGMARDRREPKLHGKWDRAKSALQLCISKAEICCRVIYKLRRIFQKMHCSLLRGKQQLWIHGFRSCKKAAVFDNFNISATNLQLICNINAN